MSKYIGKICPYCKTVFTEDDDIVLCSSCEMPHHKDCWIDNEGCTTFGCIGTIMAPPMETEMEAPLDFEFDGTIRPIQKRSVPICCKRCGAWNSSGARTCTRCGAVLRDSEIGEESGSGDPASPQGADSEDELALLVGKKTEYYIQRFTEMTEENRNVCWNWCAFLFAPFWLIYRKLYGWALPVIALVIAQTVSGGMYLAPAMQVVDLLLGLLGNRMYMNSLEKKRRNMAGLAEAERERYVKKKGGTAPVLTALALIACGAVYFVYNLYFAKGI